MAEPFALVSVAEMRALEAAAVAAGTPERVLQERAGLAVGDVIEAELATPGQVGRRRPSVLVLAGTGNNGRDGVVAGRRLAARGCRVQVWHGPRSPLSRQETRDLVAEGVSFHQFEGETPTPALMAALGGADVVVDGLLGVGSRGPMRPELAAVARAVRETRIDGRLVAAVDVPSGIDADTGDVPGSVVSADVTVTFGAVKTGLLRFPAAHHVGRLVTARIGLPAGSTDALPYFVLDEAHVRQMVPERPLDAHKYRLGRVLVVAGSDQYVGAACMCSEAAARAGAGFVSVATTEAVKHVLAGRLPEATYPLTVADLDAQPEATADRIAELLPGQDILLVGPGLGRAPTTDRFVRRLLAANGSRQRVSSAIIDADALSLLAGWERWWEQIGEGNVLTPHAGEMARLLESDPELEKIDGEPPWETARRAAARWNQIVALKGPFTAVAASSGPAYVYPHANSALATAGTGDVLAGTIAGLGAQRGALTESAMLGVVVHALAARRATTSTGRRTLVASDLTGAIPRVLAALEAEGDRR
ncbi:MAG: NAD(P)H-hydrate dehydratase [Chloroflexota bacterium]